MQTSMSAHPIDWVRELRTVSRPGGVLDHRLTERAGASSLSDLLCPSEKLDETFGLRTYDQLADREYDCLQASSWLLQGSELARSSSVECARLLESPGEIRFSAPHNSRVKDGQVCLVFRSGGDPGWPDRVSLRASGGSDHRFHLRWRTRATGRPGGGHGLRLAQPA